MSVARWGHMARLASVPRLVCIGEDGSDGFVTYSGDDGDTWALGTPANANRWVDVAASATAILAVAANAAAGDPIMRSTNGLAWTAVASPLTSHTRIIYIEDLTLFIAGDASGNIIISADDGVTWVAASTVPALGAIRGFAWDGDVVVLVGDAGTVATSPDGDIWTLRVASVDNDWADVKWASWLDLFVAIASNGTGDQVMTSPTGASWTTQTTGAVSRAWCSLEVAESARALLALASTPTDIAYFSANGVLWTEETISGVSNPGEWVALTWIAATGIMYGAGTYVIIAVDLTGILLQFLITVSIDDNPVAAVNFYIQADQPTTPSNGDLWLDTSETDTNLGNATAGTLFPARGGYLLKRYDVDRWLRTAVGGQKGARATVPIIVTPQRGARVAVTIENVQADRRWQIEGFGELANPITAAR